VKYAAVRAGIASLEDKKYRDNTIKKIIKGREWMEKEVKKIGKYNIFESQGNFIFLLAAQLQVERIKKKCEQKKVSLRFFQSVLANKAVRITVGTMKQNRQVINVLKQCI
jgi:histidinol-phosphate/aromatic aminotransferase/cobyric acid decarboxylase-like protein